MRGDLLGIDTWAFVERFTNGGEAAAVDEVLTAGPRLFTTRDVVAETFTFITARTRSSAQAWKWWRTIVDLPIDVHDGSLETVVGYIARADRRGDLSFTDYSLAARASQLGATDIATADRGFRRLGLVPLFAK